MENKKILLFGGTGFLGKKLKPYLEQKSYSVQIVSRFPKSKDDLEFAKLSPEDFSGIFAVINLAGEPVASRWTASTKEQLVRSRVDFTKSILEKIYALPKEKIPKVWLNSSAVGYYGSSKFRMEPVTEKSKHGEDFLSSLSVAWEESARPLESLGTRLVVLRTGIVLERNGGALSKMLPAFQMFAGGKIGTGEQGMSWIHWEDWVMAVLHLLENPKSSGAYNLVSPNPVSNLEFSETLARVLHRPCFFPVPEMAISALFGEGSVVITQGQYVLPERLLSENFSFRFPNLDPAITNLLL